MTRAASGRGRAGAVAGKRPLHMASKSPNSIGPTKRLREKSTPIHTVAVNKWALARMGNEGESGRGRDGLHWTGLSLENTK